VRAGAQTTGSAPAVAVGGPAGLLARVGGGVLLVEAVLADLLLGFGDPSSSPLGTVLLLAFGALLAWGAAPIVRPAPRSAALLCLLAAGLAGAAQLPFFVARFKWHCAASFSKPFDWSLGQVYAPLLVWIVAATPLAFAAALALRRASRSRREHAG
jgi:hypothetical protein